MKYKVEIEFVYASLEDIINWCYQQFEYKWKTGKSERHTGWILISCSPYKWVTRLRRNELSSEGHPITGMFMFKNEEDAVAFKLRWL